MMSSKQVSGTEAQEMQIQGVPLNTGIAIGELLLLNRSSLTKLQEPISKNKVKHHKEKFKKAQRLLLDELDEMLAQFDADTADIIESQKHIVSDPEIEAEVFRIIENDLNSAGYAIHTTYNKYISRLRENGSSLFRQRIVDLENLSTRLVNLVSKKKKETLKFKNAIVAAPELGPMRLIEMHKSGMKGLVLRKSGITSHAALIARSLGIPCIVNAKGLPEFSGGRAILDSNEGVLILNPGKLTERGYSARLSEEIKRKKALRKAASLVSETADGSKFTLQANLEFLTEFDQIKSLNIEDIGLLRTEWLLLNGNASEEEQIRFYTKVLRSVKGSVTIRLFDVGGDKLGENSDNTEKNPFLGMRGLRLLLRNEHLLRTQLKAILKVSGKAAGRIKILIPMVSVEEELSRVTAILHEVKSELLGAGVSIDAGIPAGIMIEVPAAALMADKLARYVDFFSIGTNDLTQYTLAADRGNVQISHLYQHYHPAVWQLINITAAAARANNIPVSVCGELAGDALGACGLMGLGISELSMAPSSIPLINKELSSYTGEEFAQLGAELMTASNSEQIIEYFEKWRTKHEASHP